MKTLFNKSNKADFQLYLPRLKIGLKAGLKESISVNLAGAIFSFIFVIVAHLKGFNPYQISLMNASIYAGVLQVVSLSILVMHPINLFVLLITSFTICARYFLMGLSINPLLKKIPLIWLVPSLFLLVDENWIMTMMKSRKQTDHLFLFGYYLGNSLLAYGLWIIGALAGLVFLNFIHASAMAKIDFIFTGLFIALLVQSYQGKKEIVPWIITFATAIISKRYFNHTGYLIIAAAIGSASAVFIEFHSKVK